MVELSNLLNPPLTQTSLRYTEVTLIKLVAWVVRSNRMSTPKRGTGIGPTRSVSAVSWRV